MREWIDLFENFSSVEAMWVSTRSKKVIMLPEGEHHNTYLMSHLDEFGIYPSDVSPYLSLNPENEDDFDELINSRDLRSKALVKGWCRVMTHQNNRSYDVNIEAQTMRTMYRALLVLMDYGIPIDRNSTIIYDLTEPHRSGNLRGERSEDFIATGRF